MLASLRSFFPNLINKLLSGCYLYNVFQSSRTTEHMILEKLCKLICRDSFWFCNVCLLCTVCLFCLFTVILDIEIQHLKIKVEWFRTNVGSVSFAVESTHKHAQPELIYHFR